MTFKENFLKSYKPGNDLTFGSNTYGYWDKEGEIFVNSHNEEQFFFKNVEDFCSFWFDDNDSTPHSYQTYVGDRTEIDFERGTVTLDNGTVVPDVGFCPDEDGSQVWSVIEKKNV